MTGDGIIAVHLCIYWHEEFTISVWTELLKAVWHFYEWRGVVPFASSSPWPGDSGILDITRRGLVYPFNDPRLQHEMPFDTTYNKTYLIYDEGNEQQGRMESPGTDDQRTYITTFS